MKSISYLLLVPLVLTYLTGCEPSEENKRMAYEKKCKMHDCRTLHWEMYDLESTVKNHSDTFPNSGPGYIFKVVENHHKNNKKDLQELGKKYNKECQNLTLYTNPRILRLNPSPRLKK